MYTNKTIIPPKNKSNTKYDIHFEEIKEIKILIMRVRKTKIKQAKRGVFVNNSNIKV